MKKRTLSNLKTLGLAFFAVIAFIWACVFTLEIPRNIVENYVLMSLLMLAVLILLAFLAVGLFRVLKIMLAKSS